MLLRDLTQTQKMGVWCCKIITPDKSDVLANDLVYIIQVRVIFSLRLLINIKYINGNTIHYDRMCNDHCIVCSNSFGRVQNCH